MFTSKSAILTLSIAFLAIGAQPESKPAALQIVELKGDIVAVNLTAGGMPSITVAAGGRRQQIRLGSIRYLIANNFSPKAGQPVIVRAFDQRGIGLVAVSVELPQSKQKLLLRDENGLPLWRGGQNRMVSGTP